MDKIDHIAIQTKNIDDSVTWFLKKFKCSVIYQDDYWAMLEFKNMKLATPVNEGWIFHKDRKAIKLFASYDKEDDGTITFGDRTMIPKSWVIEITEI